MAGTGKCPECGRWVDTNNYIFADHARVRGGQFLCDGSGMRDAKSELAVLANELRRKNERDPWAEHVRAGGD